MDPAANGHGFGGGGERGTSQHGPDRPYARVARFPEGQAYIAAGHERIPNLGQQTLNVTTNEGYETQTVYQIAQATRPLTAVGTTCDKGNLAVYGPAGGCIYNLDTGIQTNFARRREIYELDLWMRTGKTGGGAHYSQLERDFPRLGR